jgi:hypothetical protein
MIDANKLRPMLARFDRPSDLPQPGPGSDALLDAFEKRLGFRVPDDLRQWLKISNGALTGSVVIYGIYPNESPLSDYLKTGLGDSIGLM